MEKKIADNLYIKILFIFIILFFFKFNDSFLRVFLSYFFNYTFDIENIKYFFKLCNSERLINKKKYKQNIFPKVSIISPVYNRKEFILRFLRSVQNQKFNDIEIMLIDDCSIDNSSKLIVKYQENDERIILIKNKKNKGTLISRTIGALKSRGEYLIFPDPDDIISKNIINFCYNFIRKYNYEMLRFNLFTGNSIFFQNIVDGLESKIIKQPELSTFLFYGKGKLLQIDFNISNTIFLDLSRYHFIPSPILKIKKFYLIFFIYYSITKY